MIPQFTRYVAALVPFLVMDMIWLARMAPRFYKPVMGDIAVASFNLLPAIAFYALYPIGIVLFAVNPAMKSQSFLTAMLYGALFGLFTYGTYDLTNQATLRNWTWQLSLVDMAWGTFLAAASATVAFFIASRLPAV